MKRTATTKKDVVKRKKSLSQTASHGRRITKSTTRKHVKDLGNGTTITTQEEDVEFNQFERRARITFEAETSFRQELITAEEATMAKTPETIIATNKYLSWRRQYVLTSCNSFSKLQLDTTLLGVEDVARLRPKSVVGDGFVAKFDWDDVMAFAIFQYDREATEAQQMREPMEVSKKQFINDFMATTFIDKLLVCHFEQTVDSAVLPRCTSGIGPIRSVDWGNSSVDVVENMSFTFGLDERVPAVVRGYTFLAPVYYFPLDVMLLIPECRKIYQLTLESDRRDVLGSMQGNPGFQNYVSNQLKHEKSA
jgi:hypothetical protein